MRVLRLCALLASVAVLSGCIASTTVIRVKADGSGTIEQTTTMKAAMAAQMQQMTAGLGGGKGDAKGLDLFSEKEARAAAAKLGEGVTFVSSKPIKTAEVEGTVATYAFTDITKIRVDQNPPNPGGDAAGAGMGKKTAAEDMKFGFAHVPGANSTVTITFPEPKFTKEDKEKAGAAGDPTQMAMMGQMLDGLKVAIFLEPEGQIIKTNSPYVTGSRVTLLEMDFSALLKDPAMMTKMQGANSIEEAKAVLKDVKGFKVNLDREVRVEFAGR